MFDEETLGRLRCPLTHGQLAVADPALVDRINEQIRAGSAPTRGGQPHHTPIDGGLVTEDRRYLYPVRDGIVSMLVDQALELDADDPLPSDELSSDELSNDGGPA